MAFRVQNIPVCIITAMTRPRTAPHVHEMTVELSVSRWGAGGAAVLLVHGINGSGATWWQIADGLARWRDAHVVAPDLRGHAASPRSSRYAAVDYCADLVAVGEGWDLVVGHSLGGLLAAQVAQSAGFARRLVLIDPVFDIAEDDFALVTQANLDEVLEPDSAADYERDNPRWHVEDARLKAEAVRAASPTMTERTMHDNRPWRHHHLALSLDVPTLVLGGDPKVFAMFDPELGRRISDANPVVEYRTVEGTGHSVHRDAPGRVLDAILGWWA